MTQNHLEFLSLSIPEAMKVLGSINTVEYFPESTRDAVLDLAEAALACYPDARDAYYDLMGSATDFNQVAEAYRILVPAVESTVFPLATEYGAMDSDTPLIMTVPEVHAMELLGFAATFEHAHDREIDAVVLLTERMLDRYPDANAAVTADLYSHGFDYFAEAHKHLTKARGANQTDVRLAA
jgi:hypothetical protein